MPRHDCCRLPQPVLITTHNHALCCHARLAKTVGPLASPAAWSPSSSIPAH